MLLGVMVEERAAEEDWDVHDTMVTGESSTVAACSFFILLCKKKMMACLFPFSGI